MEAVSAPGGGRGRGGVAVFLVTPVRVGGPGGATRVVVEVEIGGAAVGAASSAATPTAPAAPAPPEVSVRLQQELPVNGLQVQIVHAKHGAGRLGRHFTAR
jgi:hypothetical protein